MAQVLSNGNLDFSKFNWGAGNTLENFEFRNNENVVLDSNDLPGLIGTYRASDMIGLWSDGTNFEDAKLKFLSGGDNIVLNSQRNPVSGQITGLIMAEILPSDNNNFFAITGFNVSLVSLFNAGLTSTRTDDQALLRKALGGNDRIVGSQFADKAYGANGNDKLIGNAGNDTLTGDAGNDSLTGGIGNDSLLGGSGNDSLTGGTGTDKLQGGTGQDRLDGGVGAERDIFVFASKTESSNSASRDVILNFLSGTDDISLTLIDANGAEAGNGTFGFGNKTAGANKVWYAVASGNATVFGDSTGDGVADFSIKLMGVTKLSAGDFLL